MPTYSYRCTNCEHVFDSFHSMNCTDPQLCPRCENIGKKLLSASSIIFKGSGFYSTDYRDSGYLQAKDKDESKGKSKSDTVKSGDSTPTTSPGSSDAKPSDSGSSGKDVPTPPPPAATPDSGTSKKSAVQPAW